MNGFRELERVLALGPLNIFFHIHDECCLAKLFTTFGGIFACSVGYLYSVPTETFGLVTVD